MIPITVIITTRNEAKNLPFSLPPLIAHFDEVIILDSGSNDDTCAIARDMGATVIHFQWNERYPKKRQWALENIPTRHDMIFFFDADEIITNDFVATLKHAPAADGYFISSRMVWNGRALRFGARNHKLCLFDKRKFAFPFIDDLDIAGMGEMEGHYQPLPLTAPVTIATLTTPIIHHDRKGDWHTRHDRYVQWEAAMTIRNLWPRDPVLWRDLAKQFLRGSRLRPALIFLHGYIFKFGFLDGRNGFDYAFNRARYTHRIGRAIRHSISSR